MERLSRLFLSIGIIALIFSCTSKEEKITNASEFGFQFYQGTPVHMNAFAYALEIDSTNAENWRELSVTYLKRGIPHRWKYYMDKAVAHDAALWQPYRGYNYLWFYKDYEKAIADFNASDTLTPDFIDAPQGHSVDFWRGIAYLGLKDYTNSIAFFEKHIAKETVDSGEDWVELEAFLYLGIAYYENDNIDKGLLNIEKLINYSKDRTADGKYYMSLLLKEKGQLDEALTYADAALKDYDAGYFNNRPYVETLRQLYKEDIIELQNKLKK